MNMVETSGSFAPLRKRVEVLTDVPAQRLDNLMQELRDAGAEVSASPQPNGLYKVQSIFLETLDAASSSNQGRPVYKRPLSGQS